MNWSSFFTPSHSDNLPVASRNELLVKTQNPLTHVLSFTGHTIDDVINDPIARHRVRFYFRLHRWVGRASEISDLERQWNGV